MAARPTTTSLAILGLIAEHGCSPYELAKRMEINLAYFWPAARSHVFTEVKKLEKLGYVTGRKDRSGKRLRTDYVITRAGQKVLAQWLGEAPKTFALQLEGLVRVYFASAGTRDDLLMTLRSMQAEAEKMLRIAGVIVPAYVADRGPYQHHMHLRAVIIDFLTHFAEFTRAWAERNIRVVERWDNLALAGKEKWARQLLATVPHWPPDIPPVQPPKPRSSVRRKR